MSAFTPGPWGLESATRSESGSDLVITDGEGGYTIAVCRSSAGVPDVEQAEANARLIAAAPDLYAVLREAVDKLDAKFTDKGEEIVSQRVQYPELLERARAALAKAEGK